MAGLFIYAGNISRGTAALVLQLGCPPLLMPILIGVVTCPIACGLLVLVDREPGPSLEDVEKRSKRQPMTAEERNAFLCEWWPGLLAMLVSYAVMTGLRSFRDFYPQQIFAAALGQTTVLSFHHK